MTQAAAEFSPVRFEVALVLDRLLLDMFERHKPALPIVTCKLGRAAVSMPHLSQSRRQVDRVMNAAVHAHSTQRIVDVRSIAHQEGASELKCLCDPLVHPV